ITTVEEVSDEKSCPPDSPEGFELPRNGSRALAPDNVNRVGNAKPTTGFGDGYPTDGQGVVDDVRTKFTTSKTAPLWDKYVKIAEAEDRDILEDWEGFVLESSKNLKPDQAASTVIAIRELTGVVRAGLQLPAGNSPSIDEVESLGNQFQPSMITVWVNCLWYLSLGLSISVSLFAMLAKRWCYKSRSRHSGTAYERAMRRQEVWDALQKWKLELLIEQLSTFSNDKVLINEVLEYVTSFPEVVLDSFSSSQELYDATAVITGHFQRLKHDPTEWHDLNTTNFDAKCGRFIYLIARSWLHRPADVSHQIQLHDIYTHMFSHDPSMSDEEFENQINLVEGQAFSAIGCTLWLERQAVVTVLGCRPERGLRLCKTLYQAISTDVPLLSQATETYSTLSWIFLNTVVDAHAAFWPTSQPPTRSDRGNYTEGSRPKANCDSTLTLSCFCHSETRKEKSLWLAIVGVSGMIYIYTHYPKHEDGPDSPTNREYFSAMIELLHVYLSRAVKDPKIAGSDPSVGKLPVYYRTQLCLYELDSLQYCYDALDLASKCPAYATFSSVLEELKGLIPESRRIGSISDGVMFDYVEGVSTPTPQEETV
ncbi:hypothetical protein FRC11_006108, partial [Ceratobasidium sp. 423]